MTKSNLPTGIDIRGDLRPEYDSILTPDALAFLADLARTFTARRNELLQLRETRQAAIDAGTMPDFLPDTAAVPRRPDLARRPGATPTCKTAASKSPDPPTAK